MKKLKTTLLAALMVMAGTTMNSCTDYQDEIDALDYRVTVLEGLERQLNANLEATQTLVVAMEDGDYITNVTPIDGGYIITFHNAGAITVYDGVDGKNGKDGRDAQVPNIGIAQDTTDGNYYWTLNGEWLMVGGQKVRANGHDGKDGEDGQSSAPQIHISEDGYWEISIDGGITWITTGTLAQGKDGKDGRDGRDGKDGEDGKDGKDGQDATPIIDTVTVTVQADGSRTVTFTFGNGLSFTIPLID